MTNRRSTSGPAGLQAVADAAGVSKSTVSRALRNDPRLRPETCSRIRALADRLGYVPDRELAETLTRNVHRRGDRALRQVALVGDLQQDGLPFREAEIAAGAERFADQFGYRLTLCDCHDPIERFAGYDGLLLLDYALWRDGPYGWVDPDRLHVVAVEPNAMTCRLDAVAANHWATMLQILDTVADRGYQRIGCALHRGTDRSSGHQWSAAYRHWHAQQQRTPPPLFSDSLRSDAALGFSRWVTTYAIDAVVSRQSVRRFVTQLDRPIGVANLGVRDPASATCGMLQNYQALGSEALRLLDTRVRTRQQGLPDHPRLVLVGQKWHEGRSLPRKR